mmetsp:Transcript_22225/g.48548  ORF Transcript_22225/g.48548 Transcript_22225/m.48548 type:complete len:154 (+) Transcript_22225:86-547(+)|eukprot:CAMPEP_0202897418 /NCGR_PEP_ID=MMETSP1392-20130828/6186_1 /ASSEMBLY_ACC=CAM_ASM_000868 /TAXON_ID=225041 /ORGANISM="Chlamydomonas chlamydogama, Strain SAG 11-48b" /LENGTH=153 /DNA_ID=CAMNT_0049583043 /DNA_START=79 /DNA_END=540 /DNA_ORIENTATION=-
MAKGAVNSRSTKASTPEADMSGSTKPQSWLEKNRTKLGYTLMALSAAIATVSYLKPKIDDPNMEPKTKKQLSSLLIFILMLLFGAVKNFVWANPVEQQQQQQQKEQGEQKEQGDKKVNAKPAHQEQIKDGSGDEHDDEDVVGESKTRRRPRRV